MSTQADIAREYIRANPDTPHRTIARIMRADQPNMFASVEVARSAVRVAVGSNGKLSRANCKKDDFTDAGRSKLERELDAVQAGIPDETDLPLLPRSIGCGDRWLAIGDLHIPEHSKTAIETQIWHAKKNGVKNVLFMGDAVEHSRTSRHPHDPNKADPYGELKALTGYVKFMRQEFKGRIVYKAGNHENNLRRYVFEKAPELAELVGFKRYGIEYIDDNVTLSMGKLSGIHGHEYKGGSPLFPAQWLLRKARTCAFTFHFHKADTARGKTATDAVLSCWSVGCGRSLSPSWCTKNEWTWGHAIIDSHIGGNFDFLNYLILGHKEVVPA
jgi:predicted phosphodiesterase